TLRASALYQRVSASNRSIVALNQSTGAPLYGDLSDDNVRAEPFRQHLHLYDLTLTWSLPWAQLISASSYQQFQNFSLGDISATVAPYSLLLGVPGLEADFANVAGVQKFTQEVRLASAPGRKLRWLLGGFYTHEISNKEEVVNFYDATGAPLTTFDP